MDMMDSSMLSHFPAVRTFIYLPFLKKEACCGIYGGLTRVELYLDPEMRPLKLC